MTESELTLYNKLSPKGKDLYDFYSIKHKDWTPIEIVKKIICREELLEMSDSLDYVLWIISKSKEQEEYNSLCADDKKLYDIVTIKHPNWTHSQKMVYAAINNAVMYEMGKNIGSDIVI